MNKPETLQKFFTIEDKMKVRPSQPFDPNAGIDIKKVPGDRYWMFSDLVDMFGGFIHPWELTPDVKNAVTSHMPNRQMFTTMGADKFASGHIQYTDDGNDAQLTRFATWAALKQHPELIAAQIFVMSPSIKFRNIYNTAYNFARLYSLNNLRTLEKELNKKLHQYDIQTRIGAIITQDAFFGGLSVDDVKQINKINISDKPDPLTNYMPTNLLQERASALESTLVSLNKNPNYTRQQIKTALHDALTDARRNLIYTTGNAPEESMTKIHVRDVASELHKFEKAFIRKYANRKFH